MKRSNTMRSFTIGIAAISAFSLAACKEETVEASFVKGAAECSAQTGMTEADCKAAEEAAIKQHLETAPRYDGLATCEAEHGTGKCQADPAAEASSGGGMGSVFLPLMAGYPMGNMMSGGGIGAKSNFQGQQAQNERDRRGGAFVAPAYNMTGSGHVATANGQSFSPATKAVPMSKSTFNKAPTTIGKAPMSQTSVRSTGGFGGRASVGS